MEPPEEQPIPHDEWWRDFTNTWNGYQARAAAHGVILPDAGDAADRCLEMTDLQEIVGNEAAREFLVDTVMDAILG
jgi:hypothetical protein